jgi:hypothetical protein
VAIRIEIPGCGSKESPAFVRVVRVFQIADDGSETELQGVRTITIKIRPGELIYANIETHLSTLNTMSVVSSHTVINTLCVRCEHEVSTPSPTWVRKEGG